MAWSYFRGKTPLVKNVNFKLKLWESFICTLIQINLKEQIYLITFQFFDPPHCIPGEILSHFYVRQSHLRVQY